MPTANDMALEGFPKFSHEPFYNEYTRENLTVSRLALLRPSTPHICANRASALLLQELFGAAGLRCVEEDVAWVTKVMVFEKPLIDDAVAQEAPPASAAHAEPALEVVTPDATIAPRE